MAHGATQAIEHFVGYLHLTDLLNRDDPRYLGAPEHGDFGYVADAVRAPDEGDAQRPLNTGASTPFGAEQAAPLYTVSIAANAPLYKGYAPIEPIGPALTPPPTPIRPEITLQARGEPFVPPDATLSYIYADAEYKDIVARQINEMLDDDIVIAQWAYVSPETYAAALAHVAGAEAAVSELIDIAEGWLPAGLDAYFRDHPGLIDRAEVSERDMETVDLTAGRGEAPEAVEGTSRTINGEEAADESQASHLEDMASYLDRLAENDQDAELADARGADDGREGSGAQSASSTFDETIETLTGLFGPDAEAAPTKKGSASASGEQASAEFGPEIGPSQTTETGENIVINSVVLQDFNDAFGGRIVLGDVRETNVIAQLNVFSGEDALSMDSAVDAAIADAFGGDTFTNDATFVDDPGALWGGSFVWPGTTNWNVAVNQGDYYDTTIIEQYNTLSDDDISLGAPTQADYFTQTGANDLVNAAQVSEVGMEYDLIIVAGDVIKLNGIYQINILYDADIAALTGISDGQTVQSLDGGSNEMINDAAIFSTGGQSGAALNNDAQAVVDAVQAGDDFLAGEDTWGLLDNGDGAFNVLYVTGDYYNHNMIMQVNVVSDADYMTEMLSGAHGDADGDGMRGDYEFDASAQDATTGGNLLINTAAIIEQDVTSQYQFVGGETTSEALLVQANIIATDEEMAHFSDDADALTDEAVATVAALVDEATEDDATIFMPSGAAELAAGADVMGGMMA